MVGAGGSRGHRGQQMWHEDKHRAKARQNQAAAPCAPVLPYFPEEKSILGVIYGVLLWADMNAATPLGAWGRSVMSLEGPRGCPH